LYIFIIGAVTCIVTYISLKVSLSFLHLLIHYLKKIAEKDEEEKTSHFEK